MNTYIVLFRGVNVGGHNILPMKSLKTLLEGCGCADVRTYVQSGNVIFRSRRSDSRSVGRLVKDTVLAHHGFGPQVLVMTPQELDRAAAGNPFRQAGLNPRLLHLFFLAAVPPAPDLAGLERLKAEGDEFVLKDHVFYLYTPGGLGNSKLAQKVERLLGVEATARNWNTVTALLGMSKTG